MKLNTLKLTFAALAAGLAFGVAGCSKTAEETAASNPALDTPARREKLEALAWERFDFSIMSRAVVAKYWRRFSDEQKDAFIREFKAFLSRTYGVRIERYTTETVEIVGERTTSRGNVMVLTRIVGGEFGGAEVEYMLTQVDAGWRIIDVKIEGISLVLNYRDQFKSVLARDGPDDAAATERGEMTPAEPVDRGPLPMSPQSGGVLRRNDAITAPCDDQHLPPGHPLTHDMEIDIEALKAKKGAD